MFDCICDCDLFTQRSAEPEPLFLFIRNISGNNKLHGLYELVGGKRVGEKGNKEAGKIRRENKK
jgi:hypothetical protein